MHKLYIACAILVPLFGCTGMVGDNSSGSGGSTATSEAAGSSGTVTTGSSGNAGVSAGFAGAGVGIGAGGATGSGAGTGSGGIDAAGGTSAIAGGPNGGACTVDALPAGVQALLTSKCATCHGAVPLAGLPSLVSYANLTAVSNTDPTKTNALLALARMQSTTSPMPPAPGTRATVSEISALQAFVTQGYPKPSCPTGTGGASGTGGSSGSSGATSGTDPLNAKPTCSSMTSWTGGNRGSASMNPGLACISCHSSGDGPTYDIAGTVYPTGHEPDRCNSAAGTDGARIEIIGADGKMLTLTPNAVGNFFSNSALKTPYQAKVTYQGRERLMATPQSNGDCNSCHSQNGSNSAPGRITLP